MLNHRLKDVANKFGGKKQVIQHLRNDMTDVMSKIVSQTQNANLHAVITELKNRGASQEWWDFVSEVLKIIEDGLGKNADSVIMPTALHFGLQKALNYFLSKKNLVDQLHDKLNLVWPCDRTQFSFFLFDLLWELIDRSILFVCKSMLNSLPTPKVLISKGDTGHSMTHQLIHHVAGFSLYHHVCHANRYPRNQKLQRMKDCILSKFAQAGSPPEMDSQDKAYWTHLLNRKSLMFVKESAFPFYLKLGNLLLTLEESDGSLLIEKVLSEVVKNCNMLALWDSIVDNILPENESFDLLIKIVKVVARTYGRGSMLKKMNLITKSTVLNKQTLGVSHRARLI